MADTTAHIIRAATQIRDHQEDLHTDLQVHLTGLQVHHTDPRAHLTDLQARHTDLALRIHTIHADHTVPEAVEEAAASYAAAAGYCYSRYSSLSDLLMHLSKIRIWVHFSMCRDRLSRGKPFLNQSVTP